MFGLVVIATLATLFGYIVGMTALEAYESTGLGVITGALISAIVSTTFSVYAFRRRD